MDEQVFRSGDQPEGDWQQYIKVVPTSMIKVDGPFTVETSEGPLHCQDGYLAKDARGYFYPIATDEQKLIYREVPNV